MARAAAAPPPEGLTGRQAGLTQTSMHTGLLKMGKVEVDDKVSAFLYANGISCPASCSVE